MIAIVILAHEEVGRGLLASVAHILGTLPERLEVQAVDDSRQNPDQLRRELAERIGRLDDGSGTLILADIFGASHCNAACGLLDRSDVELVSGVNLPMLVAVLNHRDFGLERLRDVGIESGRGGIVDSREHRRAAPRGSDAA